MRKTTVGGIIALGVVIAGAVYLIGGRVDRLSVTPSHSSGEKTGAGPTVRDAQTNSGAHDDITSPAARSNFRPIPADPRVAAMQPSPDNGLIEFVRGPAGKVISEIDNDPGSLSYRKPLREYMYSGDQVIGLISYRYMGDQIEITKTAVAYKPDGSVDNYKQDTSYATGGEKPKR